MAEGKERRGLGWLSCRVCHFCQPIYASCPCCWTISTARPTPSLTVRGVHPRCSTMGTDPTSVNTYGQRPTAVHGGEADILSPVAAAPHAHHHVIRLDNSGRVDGPVGRPVAGWDMRGVFAGLHRSHGLAPGSASRRASGQVATGAPGGRQIRVVVGHHAPGSHPGGACFCTSGSRRWSGQRAARGSVRACPWRREPCW